MKLIEKQERYKVLISRIITNKGVTTSAIYQIGLDLKEIQESEIYLLDCRDFKQFLETRVDMERSTAYLAIEMTKSYTIREFNKWGLRKLMIIKRQLPEEENRKEFMKTHSVESVRQIPPQITEFKLDKGIKEVKDFKEQIGKSRTGEQELTLIRQWSVIEGHLKTYLEFKEALKSEIGTFLSQSKKYSSNPKIIVLIVKAEQRYKQLEE